MMSSGIVVSLLGSVLVGVAATVTMDVMGIVSRRVGLAAGAEGRWVGFRKEGWQFYGGEARLSTRVAWLFMTTG